MTSSDLVKNVIMVGPFPKKDDFRGISSVLSAYFTVGDFGNYRVTYIATTSRGNILLKVLSGITGILRLVGRLLRGNVHLVHIHSATRASFYRKTVFASVAKLFGTRVMLHIHGATFKEFYASQWSVTRRMFSAFFEWMDGLIVLSPSWKAFFESIAPASRVHVLFNPVNGRQYGNIPGRNGRVASRVLYMTMLNENKGIFVLLKAIPAVLKNFPQVQFLLCGGGEIEKCKMICRETGIEGNVEFCGWVSGEAKIDKFGEADIFVLPSYFEGFPVSLIEAMFAGLPVVCTPVGGIADVLKDGENGLFVQPGDAEKLAAHICSLLGNAELRGRMGKLNRDEAVARFDAHVVVAQLRQVYDEVLRNRTSEKKNG